MAKILIVEDDADLAQVLADYLRREGHEPTVVGEGSQVIEQLALVTPDLLLLDVMLPGVDGLTLLRRIRADSTLPVILVTARVEEIDRLIGLESGADDYICKPFSPREVVARVKAVLRRSPGEHADAGRPAAGGLIFDHERRVVMFDGTPLMLTAREFDILGTLAARPGRVFSRRQLLDSIYADDLDVTDRAIDSHVKNLRRKLSAASDREWIRSVYGMGFAFEPD